MQSLELAVVPLDAARRGALRLATRSALVTRLLARRDSRLACLASIQIAALFALAVSAPVALFFLGPVLFGVVHLAADVRYLVLRRTLPRGLVVGSAVLAVALTCVQAAASLHWLSARRGDAISVALGVAWIALALAVSVRDRRRHAAPLAGLVCGVGAWLVAHAHLVNLALAHLHNLVAVGAWLALYRRGRGLGWTLLPVALVVAFAAVLLSGASLPWTFAHGGSLAFGARLDRLGAWLAPGARPEVAMAVTGTFVFLQGVHYAAWTGWIPNDDLRGEGTLTFRMSVRALARDFGPVPLYALAALALAFVGLAIWNVQSAVSWYMTLAKSHAWFECAVLGALFVGESPRRPAS
jgi:hypothetical protein